MSTDSTQKYKGSGAVTGPVGSRDNYGSIGVVVGAIAGWWLATISRKPTDEMAGAGVVIGAAAGSALGFVASLVDGAQSAKAGEQQHDDLVKERDRAVMENEVLQKTLLNQQTWVDRVSSRSADKFHQHER